ncbi:MAG: hypothetical protein BVN35_17760 [Proteobacteria bacterium ST_bin11]|nr:MAG: hypothetical protein BVN35_17760 [Proteobacteria bacterium ST_bin11]
MASRPKRLRHPTIYNRRYKLLQSTTSDLKVNVCKAFTSIVKSHIVGIGVVLMISPYGASAYTTIPNIEIKKAISTAFATSLAQSTMVAYDSIPNIAKHTAKRYRFQSGDAPTISDSSGGDDDDDNQDVCYVSDDDDDESMPAKPRELSSSSSSSVDQLFKMKSEADNTIVIVDANVEGRVFRAVNLAMDTDVYSIPQIQSMHWCFLIFEEHIPVHVAHTRYFPFSPSLMKATIESVYTLWKEIHRLNFNACRKLECRSY